MSAFRGKLKKRIFSRCRNRWLAISFILFVALLFHDDLSGAREEKMAKSGSCAFQPQAINPTAGNTERFRSLFNASNPNVSAFAKLIDVYLAPWAPLKGEGSGDGNVHGPKTGAIRPQMLEHVSKLWTFMSCCGHVRIIKGNIYYRFGGFYAVWYKHLRFVQSLKMIQDAINTYGLNDLTVEFFINTCDSPLSFYSSHYAGRAGFPIFSTFITSDAMDIAIPDPLDLTDSYIPDMTTQVPWDLKKPKAVFRGATTNYHLRDGNWGTSPRVRLHRLSEVNPELVDARISRWSHVKSEDQRAIEEDGVKLGDFMNSTAFSSFKYQLVVDGGGGSCRTCGVLRSNQLMVRQKTGAPQFYEPLMRDGTHMVEVKRTFSNLVKKLEWALSHDEEVQRIVSRASQLAESACTWRGRMLYWAILLTKYQDLIHDPLAIVPPSQICKSSPPLEALKIHEGISLNCTDPAVAEKQHHECIFFCGGKVMNLTSFVWVEGSPSLKNVERMGLHSEGSLHDKYWQ